MRLLFILLFFTYMLIAFDVNIKNQNASNGQSIYIEITKQQGITFEKIFMEDKVFQIFENPFDAKKLYTIIPINYYTSAKDKMLKLFYKKGTKQYVDAFNMRIKKGAYKQEKIVVDPKKVNPKSKEVLRRITIEYNEAMKIYNSVSTQNYIKSPFILPMHSKITSDFGKARVYNNSLQGYHSGTDFRAAVGTPIKCSNDGRVVLVKKRFYSGGTVVVDHGRGIYTCYFHMSRFNVEKNQLVKRGEVLGLSGKSGRVTGPHLHFAARVKGVQVDPLQLITLLNKNFVPTDTVRK